MELHELNKDRTNKDTQAMGSQEDSHNGDNGEKCFTISFELTVAAKQEQIRCSGIILSHCWQGERNVSQKALKSAPAEQNTLIYY